MSPTNIAVVCTRFIGDTLLTTPFLRALRTEFPTAQIHLLVGPTEAAMMTGCPYIDKVLLFDPKRAGLFACITMLKQQRYDRVYLLKRSFSSALMTALAGIPERIGFDTQHRGWLLTRRVPYQPNLYHEAQCFLMLLSDTPQTLSPLENWGEEEMRQAVQTLLPDAPGPRIVLHATSTNAGKCWPIDRFTQVAKALIAQYGAQIIFLGPQNEAAAYDLLIAALTSTEKDHITPLFGQTTLPQSIALLTHINLVVANDCGMIHMAAAADVPIVALFGPTRPQQWRPLARRVTVLDGHGTMAGINVQDVVDACKPYLTC